MIAAHLAAVEKYLLALSQVVANTGHSLHKGTPREWFIREFLEDHLSERVGVGTGEIIDAQAKADEPRNQIDAVIYKRDYPKLAFGGGITGFLAESVVATIEVKSTLTSDRTRCRTSRRTRQGSQTAPDPIFHSGLSPAEHPVLRRRVRGSCEDDHRA